MKQVLHLCFVLLLSISTANFLCAQTANLKQFQDGRMWVKVKSDLHLTLPTMKNGEEIKNLSAYPELMEIIQKYDATLLKKAFVMTELKDFYEINYSAYDKADEFVRDMQSLSFVEFAEKMPMAYINLLPNDYNSTQQWHLNKIEAPLAWDISTGSSKIKIAIVDNAIKRDHEDLTTQIWSNPGEIANDGIDNDYNGYIDDKYGFDVADNDPETTPNPALVDCLSPTGGFCHGTSVASCAAAATNNGKGVAGIGYNCKLIPVKVTADNSTGITHGYQGIDFAAVAGANIINCSWGGNGNSPTGQAVVTAAYNRGCLIVAGAGNDNNSVSFYPACYNHVVSVAASNATDHKSGFSCYHDSVDVTAPGSAIRLAIASSISSYDVQDGTSFASPITAGLCGLMLSANPCLSPAELEYYLETTCDAFSDMTLPTYQNKLGAGRINAKKALQAVNPTSTPTANFNYNVTSCGGIVDYTYNTANNAACPTTFKWIMTGAQPSFSTDKDVTTTYPTSGAYNVQLIVTNAFGSDTIDQIVNVTVYPYPDLTIPIDSLIGCYGDSIQINATCSTGINYSWTPSIGLSSITNLSPKAKLTAPRTYYLLATDANGCQDRDTLFIDVKPKPANVTAPDVTGAPNIDIQLNASCTTPNITYFWEPNISLTDNTIANPICNTPNSRLYQVTVTNQYNCTKSDYALVDVGVTGIDFPNGNIAAILPIYPNPASDKVVLKAELLHNTDIVISLFDINGKFISNVFEGNVPAGVFEHSFERGNLSAGIYTIAWQVEEGLMTQKITFE